MEEIRSVFPLARFPDQHDPKFKLLCPDCVARSDPLCHAWGHKTHLLATCALIPSALWVRNDEMGHFLYADPIAL